jgi:hypothetical protein
MTRFFRCSTGTDSRPSPHLSSHAVSARSQTPFPIPGLRLPGWFRPATLRVGLQLEHDAIAPTAALVRRAVEIASAIEDQITIGIFFVVPTLEGMKDQRLDGCIRTSASLPHSGIVPLHFPQHRQSSQSQGIRRHTDQRNSPFPRLRLRQSWLRTARTCSQAQITRFCGSLTNPINREGD